MRSVVFPADISSAVSEAECQKLAELAEDRVVLEIGAQYGRSTIAMAQTASVVHSVDWHLGDDQAGIGDSLPEYIKNVCYRYNVRDRVVMHIGPFKRILHLFRGDSFDFVFVDGYHDYKSVKRDIVIARRLAKSNYGVLAFHDYGTEQSRYGGPDFGVKQAVDEYCAEPDEVVDSLAIVRL